MGNCLVIHDRDDDEIRITAMDGGEILKVQRGAFAGFPPPPDHDGGVSGDDALPAQQRSLEPKANVAVERLYGHLFPAKAPPAAAAANNPGVVRVKLVISKQELKKMVHKEAISLDDMVSLMQRETSNGQEMISCRGWRPALRSIPECSDC